MKRHGNLFEHTFSMENLYAAYLDASRHKHNRRACFNFERRLAYNLDRLHESIHNDTYKPQPYYEFTIYEPKKRQIFAPSFMDLVVQHAIYRIVYPIFNLGFIDQSFACRKGKGTHKAADYAQAAIRKSKRNTYTLKMDIKKFFYSINRSKLKELIEKKIKDSRLVKIMMVFAEYGKEVGIPIGNLLSQTYALIFLNPLDHFIKRVLKARFYCRYVDDFVVFGVSKKRCLEILSKVKKFIVGFDLSLSKYVIAPVQRGINFVGYRTWASKRFIRKHSLYVFTTSIKKGKLDSAVSCLGHAIKTHSFRSMMDKARLLNFPLSQQIPFSTAYK